MKLEEAPPTLCHKYYNTYTGKMLREYEWTVLKKFILWEMVYLDKEFKKMKKQKQGTLPS